MPVYVELREHFNEPFGRRAVFGPFESAHILTGQPSPDGPAWGLSAVEGGSAVPVAALHPSAEGSGAAPGDQQDAKPYEVRVMGPNGRAERRQVWIGVTNRVSAEVLSGLNPGDVVVIGRAADGTTPVQGNGSGNRNGGGRPGAGGPRSGVGRLL